MAKKSLNPFATGANIDDITTALIESAYDEDEKVRLSIQTSLTDIGRFQPKLVLSSCQEFLKRDPKLPRGHRVALLTVIERVVSLKRDAVPQELASSLTELCVSEMTREKEVLVDWQGAASAALVALARNPLQTHTDTTSLTSSEGTFASSSSEQKETDTSPLSTSSKTGSSDPLKTRSAPPTSSDNCSISIAAFIVEKLLEQFKSGALPHYFVIKTLGDLAHANPLDIVPTLKNVLARVLPVLSIIKHDNMRWAFAFCMGQFCEAMVTYFANLDQATDRSSVTSLTAFSAEVFTAFEFMFNNWLSSSESKVRLATVQALGSMAAVMSPDQFQQQLPKLIHGLANEYKKEKEDKHLAITQSLYNILVVATKDRSTMLESLNLLPFILNLLHPLVCSPANLTNPQQLKNHNELLRCFEVVGSVFTDQVLTFLMQRVLSKDQRVKEGTLHVLRHLINRLDKELADKKALIVGGLQPLLSLTDLTLPVRRALAHVIIAMASHHYLELEGGEKLVEFIVRHCAISDAEIERYKLALAKKKGSGSGSGSGGAEAATEMSPQELRDMCDHILHLMTTTIPACVKVLWPYLFELLCKSEYTAAVPVLARCLAWLGKSKRENSSPDYVIDFDRAVNLPKPQAILARLMVLAHLSPSQSRHGPALLEALQHLSPILHPALTELWDQSIPRLIQSFQSDDWQEAKWEEYLLRLLSKSIELINDDEWTMKLGDAFQEQVKSYKDQPYLRKVTFRQWGVVLQLVNHKEYIKNKLDALIVETDHTIPQERTGCAQGYGYCASTHLDLVLEKLAAFSKDGGKGLASILKSSDKEGSHVNTLILCYGYVCVYAPPALIVSRVEVHIVGNLKPHLQTRQVMRRETLVTALDLIGKALHPTRLPPEMQSAVVLKSRDELMTRLVEYLTGTYTEKNKTVTDPSLITHPLRVLILNACATLADLNPQLPLEVEAQVMKTAAACFSLEFKPEESMHETLVFENLNKLLQTLLRRDPSVSCLQRLFSYVDAKLRSSRVDERTRAINAALHLLKTTVTALRETTTTTTTTESSNKSGKGWVDTALKGLGMWVGTLISRVMDPEPSLRASALLGVQYVLYIDHILRTRVASLSITPTTSSPTPSPIEPPALLQTVSKVRERITTEDLNEQFTLVHEVAGVLNTLIPSPDLPELILTLIDGLSDVQLSSARGCCVVLYTLLKTRGTELQTKVNAVVEVLLKQLAHIMDHLSTITTKHTDTSSTPTTPTPSKKDKDKDKSKSSAANSPTSLLLSTGGHSPSWTVSREVEQLQNGVLHILRVLFEQHLIACLDQLLLSSVPLPAHIVRALQVVAKDPKLLLDAVYRLTDILNSGDLVLEVPDQKDPKKTRRQPTPLSLSATCALSTLLELPDIEPLLSEHYAHFFGTLLLRFGSAHEFADATEYTINAFRNFVSRTHDQKLSDKMDQFSLWSRLKEDDYLTSLTTITGIVLQTHPNERRTIFAFLYPYLKGHNTAHCLVTASVFAEFVNHCSDDKELLAKVINCHLTSLTVTTIRIHALRGLSNIVSADKEELNKYSPTVLDALMSNIDDANEEIALEAMTGLSRLFECVEHERIAPVLVNICNRIRPVLDKSIESLRAAGARLLGVLSRLGADSTTALAETLRDQVHLMLPALVLHVNDEKVSVRVACKSALKRLVPLFGVEDLTKLFTQLDPEREIDYNEFLNLLSKHLIKAFPTRVNYYVMTCVEPYFKSEWNIIKGNAAMFVGYLLGNIPLDNRKIYNLNPTRVTKELISLLKEKSPLVRQKAADAMALLHTY